MGNSGSVHNINWDSSAGGLIGGKSKSELNAYYPKSRQYQSMTQDCETQTQTLLRRPRNGATQNMERIKSLPVGAAQEQFKVLPQIGAEHLKLRPTTNGRLLHSGGTITGRNKDDVLRVPGQMQRSRTLIYEQNENDRDAMNKRDSSEMPNFQRSQTLLHLPYKEREKLEQESIKKYLSNKKESSSETQKIRHARSEPDFRNDLNKPNSNARHGGTMDSTNVPVNTPSTKPTKLNKYNKKRKAPAAPVNSETNSPTNNSKENKPDDKGAIITRRFRTNISIRPQAQQHQNPQNFPPTPAASKPTYRREKSSDAILLRPKVEKVEKAIEKRFSYGGLGAEKSSQAPTPPPKTTSVNISQTKHSSRIPQLKRTFYFGMHTANPDKTRPENQAKQVKETKDLKTKEVSNENKDSMVLAKPAIVIANESKVDQSDILNYRLEKETKIITEEESQVNDNGIHVLIRPSLPRRQLEIPSFSPAAAWRMLSNLEEERHKQLQHKTSNTSNCESPIQLRSNKLHAEMDELRQQYPAKVQKTLRRDHIQTIAWTPQQDLEDDEDDNLNEVENDTTSSDDECNGDKDEEDGLLFFTGRTRKSREEKGSVGVHLFSLSLPRDVHLDAQMQKKNSVSSSNNNEKLAGFSSLQKLKLSISGGTKCTCKASIAKLTANSHNETSTDVEFCEIHSCQALYRSDNWVLHKSGTKDGANNSITNSDGKLLKDDITPTVEPISLSYLTGGKHIMYLPGINASSKDITESDESGAILRKETTPTRETVNKSSKQRQRKKDARESLQDETPVMRHTQSQHPANSSQRFSFQSTVRMLEKRRLAEKLSKDAEIREAQRKSELEAMKRVEEDFQRKRAGEKANIRHQLRLYCSGNGVVDPNTNSNNHDYNSLPVFHAHNSQYPSYHSRQQQQQQKHDTNNNKIFCRRAEPDGAASSPSPPIVAELETHRFQISHLPLKRQSFDYGDSDVEEDHIESFDRTASLVKPYLQSFMK